MKVLVIASTLPRRDGDSIPAFVLDQAVALTRAYPQLRIEILAPHDAGAARAEMLADIPVRRFRYFWPAGAQQLVYPAILPNLRHWPWLWLQVPFLFVAEFVAVLRNCQRERPALIYSHWFVPQAVTAGLVALLLKIPHVMTSHSSDVAVVGRVPLLGPLLVRFFIRRLRAFTVVSRRTGDRLRACFSAAEWPAIQSRMRVLPMGVDTANFAAASEAAYASSRAALDVGNVPVVLFMGRLTAKKGIPLLLDACQRLVAEGTDALLLIAGDGEERVRIEAQIAAMDLGRRVRMLGYVTGSMRLRCLHAADLVVLPSIITRDGDAEGLPVVLIEAMAAGKLCIASDASGGEEVIDSGQDGFLVPSGDVAALAAAMRQALALAPPARRAIGGRAACRAREFDWSVIAPAHFRHLLAVAQDPPAPEP